MAWKANTWSYADPINWRIYAALEGDGLSMRVEYRHE